MSILFAILRVFLEILTISIFVRAILSWVAQGQTNFFTDIVFHITEPILHPIRRLLPRAGYADFSPFVAIVLLQVVIFFLP